jgi:hypothetical protein
MLFASRVVVGLAAGGIIPAAGTGSARQLQRADRRDREQLETTLDDVCLTATR